MKMGVLVELRPQGFEDLSDEGLAAACAIGDRAAQGLLVRRYLDGVHRFVARMQAGFPASVDDLVQATFIAAFRSAANFRGPSLRSWLFGIAANTIRSHVRTEVARNRLVSSLADHPREESVSPASGDVPRLREAISQLPPKLREALVLVDLEGEQGADAARLLGIPVGTLWRRLSEARARLRTSLGGGS
ncbi:MAG TPA: RNA polymerase sigma factor [Kofleriaceae bacterium]|jgi:RNA polymerase sigma-70 factor (ECF subfamily)